MIDLKNITRIYRKGKTTFTALSDINLVISEGEFLAINGPSGAGKSTLLYTIGGLIRPDSGSVTFRGHDLYKQAGSYLHQYRRNHTGFMFQQFHLMPYLTVKENIILGCIDYHKSGEKADKLLGDFSLTHIMSKYPSELSVGEKQRTAFIRAVINDPAVLLADEPTGNLDPHNTDLLFSMMKEYNLKGGTVIMVSHHKVPEGINARTLTLNSGRL